MYRRPGHQEGAHGKETNAGCPALLDVLPRQDQAEMLWGGVPFARETAMSNRYARILAAGGAAALVAALGVPAALAAPTLKTWTVAPGGSAQATSGKITLEDTTTGSELPCSSSTASGTLKSGSGLAGTGIGKITSVTFKGPGSGGACAGPGGLLFTLRAGGLPWHVNLFSYGAAKGVARGTLTHIHLTMSGNGCTAMIDGTATTADDGRVTFGYTDSTGQLKLLTTNSTLHFYDVSAGCLGLVNSGDPATLSTIYPVSPKQAITSP
jgi:hypothetical protein